MKERDEIQDYIYFYSCNCKKCKRRPMRAYLDQLHYHILKYHTDGDLFYFSPVRCGTEILFYLEDFHAKRHNWSKWDKFLIRFFGKDEFPEVINPDYFERKGFRPPM